MMWMHTGGAFGGEEGEELCLDEGSGFLAAEVLERRELLRRLRQFMYQPKQLSSGPSQS